MTSASRLAALVLLGGAIAGGLVVDASSDDEPTSATGPTIEAGVAMPAANDPDSLSSTWYCAAGSATEGGIADHVVLIANPTDVDRRAQVTVLPGTIAAPPVQVDEAAGGDATTTTTTPDATTTTTAVEPPPTPTAVEVPARSMVEVALRDLIDAPLAGAVVEVDGGEIAVEHQVTGEGGRATAPCSTTAADQWSFPWGVTERGARELLVFMNPFPDDATVDVELATDEGPRESLRFQGFVVPGRSVVGAFVDEDARRAHVSAEVHVRSGRVVVDRLQTFDGTNPALEGLTLGLGAPVAAETWMFPDGRVGGGRGERVVVFNPSDEVAEVEVEVRLDDPDSNDVPEPFELTIPPSGFSLVDLDQPDEAAPEGTPKRIPDNVRYSVIVRSLNGVPITAERVSTQNDPATTVGIGATLGAPLAAPTWFFAGGGVSAERDQVLTVFNASDDREATVSFTGFADGEVVEVDGLRDLVVPAGGRLSVRLSEFVSDHEQLPMIVSADGPVVVERRLERVGGRGLSQSLGIPLATDVLVPDPIGG